MLRGRSANDIVLPSGEAPYSSREASCVGILLERIILGGPPTGLGTEDTCLGPNPGPELEKQAEEFTLSKGAGLGVRRGPAELPVELTRSWSLE
ncbi:hypothetical protein EYF80_005609 [Liparis tanakae]|uniref:Uncharacterized protein n=1 Tax=Liparis tanakae TaxID=230148 RepID=A0A4Z2J487_9TELE|nr:hypothetical protein EYF80_005609 [Liparis tanakae]